MTWTARVNALNTKILATFGETVTLAQGATSTSLTAVIRKAAEPLLIEGAVTFSEHHYLAHCRIADLATEPAMGDTLTAADGAVYSLDQPPSHEDGLYRLILRRTA